MTSRTLLATKACYLVVCNPNKKVLDTKVSWTSSTLVVKLMVQIEKKEKVFNKLSSQQKLPFLSSLSGRDAVICSVKCHS